MPPMTGSRFLAQALQGYGVTHVFFVPAILEAALAAMEDIGTTRVSCHSEIAAAYMADGYARAARRPGVCMAQAVGAANLAAGLRDAYLAGSPVIGLTGGPRPAYRYRHIYQQLEDLPMFDPVTKFNARVEQVERLPDLLRQAFRVAVSNMPGPVHLEVPGRLGESMNQEANVDLVVEERFSRYPAYRPEPELAAVQEAARVLATAERPVIVAGGGVVASDAGAELIRLAEMLAIPVATSLNGKTVMPDSHPLSLGVIGDYGRWSTNRAVLEADLVMFVGSRAGGLVTDNWKVPRAGTTIIQLDIDPSEIGRNYPTRVELLGDAKRTLDRLLEVVQPIEGRPAWTARVHGLLAEWRAQVAPLARSEAAPIRPERICREISDVLPRDAVLVADTGHAAIWSGSMIELKHPGQRYIRCAGTLGWAFPAALGVKCALPDKPVLCFTGDGGFYYHLSELETAARMGIDVVVVVNDNHALSQVKAGVDTSYGGEQRGRARDMWVYKQTDFAAIAEGMGCRGMRVRQPGDLRAALEDAFAAGGTVVIDVASDVTAFPPGPWD